MKPANMIARIAFLFMLALVGTAHAAPPSDAEAAQATEIDGLRVLAPLQDLRLTQLGLVLTYVEQDTRPGGGKYRCGGMSRHTAQQAGTVVAKAFKTLPDAAIDKARLRYIVLCSQVHAGDQEIGGFPVPPLDLLMLSTTGGTYALQHKTLHELFHLFEYRFGVIDDPAWLSRFGEGYRHGYANGTDTTLGSGGAGFVNQYATISPSEERAELFANLLLARSALETHIIRQRDELLREKVDYFMDHYQRMLGMRLALRG